MEMSNVRKWWVTRMANLLRDFGRGYDLDRMTDEDRKLAEESIRILENLKIWLENPEKEED